MIESMVCLKSYGANSSWDNQIFLIRQNFTQDRHCLQNLRTQKYLPSAWMGRLYRDNCTLCPSNFYLMKSPSQRLITSRKSNCDSIAQLTKLEQKKNMHACIYILHMCIYNLQKKGDSKQLDWCHTCSNAPRLLRSNWAKHSLTWLRSQTVTFEVKNGRSFEANLSIVCRILASLAIHPGSQHTWTSRLWWHDIIYPTSKKTFRLYEMHILGSYDTYKLTKTGHHVAKGTNWWYGSGKNPIFGHL